VAGASGGGAAGQAPSRSAPVVRPPAARRLKAAEASTARDTTHGPQREGGSPSPSSTTRASGQLRGRLGSIRRATIWLRHPRHFSCWGLAGHPATAADRARGCATVPEYARNGPEAGCVASTTLRDRPEPRRRPRAARGAQRLDSSPRPIRKIVGLRLDLGRRSR